MHLNENDKVELANLIIDLLDKYEKNNTDEIDEDDSIKSCGNKDVRRIMNKIDRYNPGIYRRLRRYGIPYPEIRRIIRRIVRLTLMYYDD